MSNEHLGFVEQRADDRERYAKYFYRAPVILAGAAETSKLTARIIELERENIALTNRVVDLGNENKRLRASLETNAPLQSVAAPSEVAAVFCKTMQEIGYEIGGWPYSIDHLLVPRRSQTIARPRHIFMWVARRACSGDSLMALGRFLQRDHSSVMHGIHRAPKIMVEDPVLRGVALTVLATFGLKAPE